MIHDSRKVITQSPLGQTQDRFLKDSPQENQTNTVLRCPTRWSFDLCFQKQILSVLKVEHFLWAEHKHVLQQCASQSVMPNMLYLWKQLQILTFWTLNVKNVVSHSQAPLIVQYVHAKTVWFKRMQILYAIQYGINSSFSQKWRVDWIRAAVISLTVLLTLQSKQANN